MTIVNTAQAESWENAAGEWIAREDMLDSMMVDVLARMLHHAALRNGEQVLDIGCGTGAASLAAASLVGSEGQVTGIDISRQMLERARKRAEASGAVNVGFLLADAQSHAFPPESMDAVISRFGMTFFHDPVAAFANIRRAARPGGRLAFASWAPIATVPLFDIPLRAAIARLGRSVPTDPVAPGPLAFQDPPRVLRLMTEAGLQGVRCLTETVVLAPAASPGEFASFNVRVGPAARLMAALSATEADAAAIEAETLRGFAEFETPQGIRIPAGVHFYLAET